MTDVIKTDGKRESFNIEKIRRSIEAAARETHISDDRRRDVINRVLEITREMAEKNSTIKTRDLRDRILRELDTLEPSISKSWRAYEQTKATRR